MGRAKQAPAAEFRSCGIVVVGDEVLAGDVEESNAVYLSRELSRLGAAVRRICVVPDREEDIAAEVRRQAGTFDAVVVTGGIGATHDDVTRQAVARAFRLPLEFNADALEAIRARYRPLTYWRRKLAELPVPCRLIPNRIGAAPGFIVRNAYVFPGVPAMLRDMFPLVADEFAGPALHREDILTPLPESAFAGPLGKLARRHAAVAIGSYPLPPVGPARVRLTLKSREPGRLAAAAAAVRGMLERLDG